MNSPHRILSPVLLAPLFLLSALTAPALAASDLPPARDLRTEAAQAAQAGQPLLVIFSRADCSYCETVKRDYLKPLAANPRYRGVLVRQVSQDSDAPLTNFRGEPSTHARVASAEKVRLVPVVAFYGPQGKHLAEPIVGARLPDFYQSYLEESIAKSAATLEGIRTSR